MIEQKQYTLDELKKKLTKKESIFCHQVIIDWNGSRAARIAGYSEKTANVIACEIIRKTHIKQYIKHLEPNYKKSKRLSDYIDSENDVGYIYLIKCIGTHYYKIGKTKNLPIGRLKAMQTGMPFDLELTKSKKCININYNEDEMHQLFKDNWIRGEWFLFSDYQIKKVINKIDLLPSLGVNNNNFQLFGG